MAVVFRTKAATAKKRPPRNGDARPRPVSLDLDQPGRLRVGHLLTLLSVSSKTFYVRKAAGLYPAPDGYEGRSPYWNTKTVRDFLNSSGPQC
ncbi:hypothetical protein BurMR1_3062 [Burkholderia sp. MR1]|nr:hypothetical protein BurMR1_3062 [Burkholderia sp. MR1]